MSMNKECHLFLCFILVLHLLCVTWFKNYNWIMFSSLLFEFLISILNSNFRHSRNFFFAISGAGWNIFPFFYAKLFLCIHVRQLSKKHDFSHYHLMNYPLLLFKEEEIQNQFDKNCDDGGEQYHHCVPKLLIFIGKDFFPIKSLFFSAKLCGL